MAITLVVCLLLLSVLSITPFTGKLFVAVAWAANANRNASAAIGVTGAATAAGYGALAVLGGAGAVFTGGLSLGISL